LPRFFSKSLYLAPAATLLTALKKATGSTVLMIGHNFGISDLANRLRKERSENPEFKTFPTGAIWIADLPIEDWRALNWGAATSVNFVSPEDVRMNLSNGPRR
jgi:phosphohistidine phosphatase